MDRVSEQFAAQSHALYVSGRGKYADSRRQMDTNDRKAASLVDMSPSRESRLMADCCPASGRVVPSQVWGVSNAAGRTLFRGRITEPLFPLVMTDFALEHASKLRPSRSRTYELSLRRTLLSRIRF